MFECEVSGEPTPTVTWLHNGQVISPSSNHKLSVVGNVHSLTLTHTGADEAGTYSVTAVNVAGQTESSAKLGVRVDGT